MGFNHGLIPGDTINNEKLASIFKCSTQSGMRRSLTTNSLVLITHTNKNLYNDRWENEVLHYTGMGQVGDQSLDFQQNKTLSLSKRININIYLFEVFKEKEYTFHGQVELAGQPYQEWQDDIKGTNRKVWVFPIKLLNSGWNPPINVVEENILKKEKKINALKDEIIFKRAKKAIGKISKRKTQEGTVFVRDPYVKEYALRVAKGVCQLCECVAPFHDKRGKPYLEVHHIDWLSKGGEDSITNTIALCANCHRKMHVLNNKRDVKKLKEKNLELISKREDSLIQGQNTNG